ncbi:hypothetical protein [Hahella ganghwensis]|uniref:hypothetical protein n=1 Tax=Hahella ganghwensis TaxID=286420 RepID=UPI000373C315|nr:hypothetical protein [Hahella ganghwensis]
MNSDKRALIALPFAEGVTVIKHGKEVWVDYDLEYLREQEQKGKSTFNREELQEFIKNL